jgi:hypothetical protein
LFIVAIDGCIFCRIFETMVRTRDEKEEEEEY